MLKMNCGAQWKPIFVMVAVNLGLATVNLFLKKILEQGTSHLVIITYRQVISALSLAPIAYFWERKSRPKLTVTILLQLFFSALVGVTLTQYLILLGLEHTSATFACAFTNMVPVITFLLSLPSGLEKVNLRSWSGKAKVLGTVICIAGAMLLTIYKGTPLTNIDIQAAAAPTTGNQADTMAAHKTKTHTWIIASMYLFAGCSFWSFWFLMQARISMRYPCQYSSTALLSSFSAIQSAVLGLVVERKFSVWILKGKLQIITVLYAGVVASGLCYVGMSWCVTQKGPVFTSSFIPLIQIFVAMFEMSILHERIYLGSVIGSILVIIGLYVLLWGKSKEIEECEIIKQAQTAQAQPRQQDEHCNL